MKTKSPGKWLSLTKGESAGAFFMLFIATLLLLLPAWLGTQQTATGIQFDLDSHQLNLLLAKHQAATDSFYRKRKSRHVYWKYAKQEDFENMGLTQDQSKLLYEKIKLGHRFSSAEELSRETGLDTALVKRFLTFKGSSKKKSSIEVININQCDTADLIALPGIGSKTAIKIIRFRDALGGFTQTQQILETKYTDTSVLKGLLPRMKVVSGEIKKIPVNSATAEKLKSHPYISERQARVMVAFRNQRGKLTLDNIKEIRIIAPEELAKMLPYLNFND